MPWKALSMSESRAAFVALARSGAVPFAQACRTFAVSRKTGYKWLRRAQGDPAVPLEDLPRRPRRSPRRTPDELEHAALGLRDAHGWGARKVHARVRALGLDAPSPRTITGVLRRHGRLRRPAPPAAPPQRFTPIRQVASANPSPLASAICPISANASASGSGCAKTV